MTFIHFRLPRQPHPENDNNIPAIEDLSPIAKFETHSPPPAHSGSPEILVSESLVTGWFD